MSVSEFSATIRRFFGALLLFPVLLAIFLDQPSSGVMLLILSIVMAIETRALIGFGGVYGGLIVALIVVAAVPFKALGLLVEPFFLAALSIATSILVARRKSVLAGCFVGLLSVCLWCASAMLAQVNGHYVLMSLAAIIGACDVGAYFVGRYFGGPKLMPIFSPNKTISGAFGGLAAAVIVAVVGSGLIGIETLWQPVIIGLLLGGMAQFGDLLESAVKRSFGVKDSGSILPGHGGLLDRFDGYLFAVPFTYLYLYGL